MRFLPLGLISLLWLPQITAIHESDVGVLDWQRSFVGVPLYHSPSTAPIFHRVSLKNTNTVSVIITATASNVLAALDPLNGTIVWRHVFEGSDRIVAFQKHENVVTALSGPGGSTLRTFDVLTGDLILEKRLRAPETAIISEPGAIRVAVAHQGSDLFVLTNGDTVNHLSSSGEVKWKWTSPDQSSLAIYSELFVTPSAVYVVGLAKSFASYTLHVTSLSPATGEVLASRNVPSSISQLADLLVVNNTKTASPQVLWLEKQSVSSFALVPTLNNKPTSLKGSYKELLDVGLNGHGQIVGIRLDGSALALGLGDDGIKVLWDFEGSAPSSETTASMYTGGVDKKNNPYIIRLYWSHTIQAASAEIFASHLAGGQGLITGFSFAFDTDAHGIISHISIDAANPNEFTVLARMVLTTSSGAVQLWQQDKHQWTREESLSSIPLAQFVELPERNVTHAGTGDEGFVERLTRQMADAQDFPQYLVNFIKRFATGSYASASSSAAVDDSLVRDSFGFRQVIVVATVHGKIFGLDSSTGKTLWGRLLGLGWAAEVGGRILPVKMFVTKTVNDGQEPVVVLVAQRSADNGLVDTVVFQFDALTGETVLENGIQAGVLHGLDVIDGQLVDGFMMDSKTIVMVDEFLQIRLFPNTEAAREDFAKAAPVLHMPLLMNVPNAPGHRRLVGHQVALNPALSDSYTAYPTWTLSLPPGETIRSIIPVSREPVASLGKVLGNRTTLYKYLNPRLTVVITTPVLFASQCGIQVVDTVKGSVLYRAVVPAAAGSCDVKATLTENWLVYHYFDPELASGQAKGYRMVSVEFYEGKEIDEKTKSSDLSSFSVDAVDIMAFEQAYVFPGGISAMTTTRTKFGISAKDLIVATSANHVKSFSRRFLNPRRPNRKTTTEEQEEYLIPYDPNLPDDPRRVLSHNYQVANVQHIITAPSLLESTSLVFAFGLDLFLTRVAPSNTFDVLSENFNKLQLVLTVAGLAFAIVVTRPMVQRKRLKEKWYQ
ncbi:hypothetical protein C8J56DRAFT_1164789 [Mycena floridula]|nr:hypothetical protein C8J56DRAFT_1164789 [Mycena floridula]